ncbi:reverse transcriptase domain-containing protein, partial [Tanacetum coccineum]
MSNQTNELKNAMASFFQMNTASTSDTGSLPSNTIANPKGDMKAIITRSGLVLDGPSVLMPPPFINPEKDERVEETLTDPDLTEFTIKVPPPLVQKAKPTSLKNYVVHQRDPCHPHIPYPSRMNQEKLQEKYEERLFLFENLDRLCGELLLTSAVILKKVPEKLGDPGKFLIPCSFSELKCKALADLGASINLMPLSVWKKLGLPELISTQITFKLANREICTPVGIARDVFVPIGRLTFPANFVIV